MKFKYDVIVIGAGHAGCEAAAAAANMGSKTLLVTMDMNRIAQMSCNPAIGGIAKGQIVREIDAIGGCMGIVADRSSIQFRMLNRSKGPAMWSPRSQNDRRKYILLWQEILDKIPNLNIWQDNVTQLLINNHTVYGVKTVLDIEFYAKTVILTNGTFLNGLIHVGQVKYIGGRTSELSATGLTQQLNEYRIRSERMKTGTPVRVDGRSINFKELTEQQGDSTYQKFSYLEEINRELQPLSCWTIYTNEDCHQIIRDNIHESPLYNGQIESIGPRNCPSIETKVIIFPNKTRHQLFLEPEGVKTNEYYLNGFSSSLPFQIQLQALQQIPAFRNIQLFRSGYAIEYDFFDPTQLYHTLESKIIKNLFFAGQINGTTGYEEAAGQGLIAGINAHIKCHDGDPFILLRDEAYIGVLIDDLVTKGVDEPYRMFTSRAEYRTLLRQDNADLRLTKKSHKIGLATNERFRQFTEKEKTINTLVNFIEMFHVKPEAINKFLLDNNTTPITNSCKLIELLKRPQIKLANLIHIFSELKVALDIVPTNRLDEIIETTEILIKYSGYIIREKQLAEKINRLEAISIANKFDYNSIQSLSIESRQKLMKIQPETIAQASRIPGISPSDINVLLILLGR